MNFLYELLVHQMIGRNVRFIRAGHTYRWLFLAFWICFALFAVTRWTALGILCCVLLLCGVFARASWRRKQYAELQQLIDDNDEHAT